MTPRISHLARLADPTLRFYLLAVVVALVGLFVVQFDTGSAAAAGVPVLCGIAGLLLRWTAMPVVLVFTLGYFQFFPIGVPVGVSPRSWIGDSHFRFDDIILTFSLLVYLIAQYRLFDLTPYNSGRHIAESSSRSISSHEEGEYSRGLIGIGLAIVAGQILWWLVANLEPHFGQDAPLRWSPSVFAKGNRQAASSTQSAELSRFLLLILGLTTFAGFTRLAFWYSRLARLDPREARLVLIDAQWRATRRELARIETWRSHRLGHNSNCRSNTGRVFRTIVRVIVLANLIGFFVWIVYTYLQYR